MSPEEQIVREAMLTGRKPVLHAFSARARRDLLAAALFIANRKDPDCVLKDADAERIVELLSDIAGMP